MQEGFRKRDPLGRVELEHPSHQVKELRVLQRVMQHVCLKQKGGRDACRLQYNGEQAAAPSSVTYSEAVAVTSPPAERIPFLTPVALRKGASEHSQHPLRAALCHLPAGACSSLARISHRMCSHPIPGSRCGSISASWGGGKVLRGLPQGAHPHRQEEQQPVRLDDS